MGRVKDALIGWLNGDADSPLPREGEGESKRGGEGECPGSTEQGETRDPQLQRCAIKNGDSPRNVTVLTLDYCW